MLYYSNTHIIANFYGHLNCAHLSPHSCVTCRCLRPRPFPRPPPPQLPAVRIQYERPFEVVGIDDTVLFPVHRVPEGRRYLTVFICIATSNVHLEVTTSLSTQDFMHALRRFAATYGIPRRILSDNGRNFQGANRCLEDFYNSTEGRKFIEMHKIEWRFQTPGWVDISKG